jgi:hypothetical protein
VLARVAGSVQRTNEATGISGTQFGGIAVLRNSESSVVRSFDEITTSVDSLAEDPQQIPLQYSAEEYL